MALYDLIKDLPFSIAETQTAVHIHRVNPEFERKTMLVRLRRTDNIRFDGTDGLGEDVTYDPAEHEHARLPILELNGSWTLESFAAHLDTVDLFPHGAPQQAVYRNYRRWAVESAALDLALKQNRIALGPMLRRPWQPVTFVSSTRTNIDGWLELYPELRFKLDATPDWTDEYIAELRERGVVDVIDLKGAYKGTPVDNPADPDLYRRVAEGLPGVWIEDPDLTPETREILEPHRDRVTWDAPIHSWADVEALDWQPKCLNSKPSRFGSLERLFEFYERCEEHGIALYGGGQFELANGRGHIQLLASLFHPDGPNDVAPRGYNETEPEPRLETSPLDPRSVIMGFERA